MPRGRKKAEHPEAARRILDAAESIFAARGLAGARTGEIAAAAHVNQALLYYYFRSKAQLHRAVLERLFRQIQQSIAAAGPANGTPRDRLLAFVNGYFDFVASHPSYPRLIQRQVMESGAQLEWMVRSFFRPFHQRLSRTIAEGIGKGEFRPVDASHTVFSIIAMTVFYFAAAPVLRVLLGRNPLRPPAVKARKQAVLDFVRHALLRDAGRGLSRRSEG
jgi:TetR/AcrR family transcriptional regulator